MKKFLEIRWLILFLVLATLWTGCGKDEETQKPILITYTPTNPEVNDKPVAITFEAPIEFQRESKIADGEQTYNRSAKSFIWKVYRIADNKEYLGIEASEGTRFIAYIPRPGEFRADLIIKDTISQSGKDLFNVVPAASVEFNVSEGSGYKKPDFAVSYLPAEPILNQAIVFEASSSDSESYRYSWRKDGKEVSLTEIFAFPFLDKERHKISVEISDSFGPYQTVNAFVRVDKDQPVITIQGPKGDKGDQGIPGTNGINGKDVDPAVLQKIQEQIDAIQEIQDLNDKEFKNLKIDLGNLQNRVKALEDAKANILESITTLTNFRSGLEKRVQVLESKPDPASKAEVVTLKSIIDGLQGQINTQNAEVATLNAKISAQAKKNEELEASLKTTEALAKAIQAKISTLEAEIKLAKQGASNAQDIANLALTTANAANSAVAAFKISLDAIEAEMSVCKSSITEQQKALDANTKAVQAAQITADKAQKTADEALKKAGVNETQIKALQVLADLSKADLALQKAGLSTLQADKALDEGRITVLEQNKVVVESNILLLQTKAEENRLLAEQAKSQADLAKAQADGNQIAIMELQGKVASLEQSLANLQTKVNGLEQRVNNAETKLEQVKQIADTALSQAQQAGAVAVRAQATADEALRKCGQAIPPVVVPVDDAVIRNVSLSLENPNLSSATVYGIVGETKSLVARIQGLCNRLETGIKFNSSALTLLSAASADNNSVNVWLNGNNLEVQDNRSSFDKRSDVILTFELKQKGTWIVKFSGNIVATYDGGRVAVINNTSPGEFIVQ